MQTSCPTCQMRYAFIVRFDLILRKYSNALLFFRTVSCHKKHTVESSVILQQNCKILQSFGRENYCKVNWQMQNTHPCTHVVPLVFLRSFLPIFVDTQIHSVP